MRNKRVLMIVLNNVVHDARVIKEALSLSRHHYSVEILGIKMNPQDEKEFYIKGLKINLINITTKKIFAKNTCGWLIKYIEYFIRVNIKLLVLDFQIVHAHNLDALLPIYFFSKLLNKQIIYDSHELFTEMSGKSDNIINKLWRKIEQSLLQKVDAVLAANESRANIMFEEYGARAKPIVIMNIPDTIKQMYTDKITPYLHNLRIFSKNVVIYQGGISKARNVDKLIKSVEFWNNNLVLFLIGPILSTQEKYFLDLIESQEFREKIIIHPPVPNDELFNYTRFADIGIIIYANDSRNNYYCAPNKLYEYAINEIPIAGCNFPEVGKVLMEYKIGESFDPENEHSISSAINKIFNSLENYKKSKGFIKLFIDQNWDIQKQRLYDLYDNLGTKI